MIDLHSHTTASDGQLEPEALVRQAWLAGVRVLAVTDHDTVAALPEARRAADGFGITLVDGIEITAVDGGRDIHVLGYFFDASSPALQECLAAQRAARLTRIVAMAGRLAEAGMPVDVDRLLADVQPGRAVGRPALAMAMLEAGHVRSLHEAFDVWIGEGRPAWAPRDGPPVRRVVELLHAAGGIASLAHPVLYGRDSEIPGWRDQGLDAIEAYHSEHRPADAERYQRLADDLGMAVTGGSDYHGERPGRASRHARTRQFGRVGLPEAAYLRLLELAARIGPKAEDSRPKAEG